MVNQKVIQTVVGFFMLLGLLALLFLAMRVSGLSDSFRDNGYTVTADFQNTGSLKAGAPVSLAGVNIGYIEGIQLDPSTFQAKVSLFIKDKYKDLDISRQYLSDILRDNNITRKCATFQHFPKTYRGFLRDEKEELKAFLRLLKNMS